MKNNKTLHWHDVIYLFLFSQWNSFFSVYVILSFFPLKSLSPFHSVFFKPVSLSPIPNIHVPQTCFGLFAGPPVVTEFRWTTRVFTSASVTVLTEWNPTLHFYLGDMSGEQNHWSAGNCVSTQGYKLFMIKCLFWIKVKLLLLSVLVTFCYAYAKIFIKIIFCLLLLPRAPPCSFDLRIPVQIYTKPGKKINKNKTATITTIHNRIDQNQEKKPTTI